MASLDKFSDITTRDVSLAPLTWLKVGGPAQFFIEPRTPDELAQVLRACHEDHLPVHLLGGGSNILVRDEGVSGAVIQLSAEPFRKIVVDGSKVRAGAAAPLSHVIAASVKAGLGGLDVLVGIPGTIGGALHGNAGGRNGDVGQFVTSISGLTLTGEAFTRRADELIFEYRHSSLQDAVVLEAEFELHPDDPQEITRRMRTLWIMKKATQPLTFQSAGCIFKNPRGMSAGLMIDQAGLKGTRIGNAEISDRHANFIIAYPEASSRDVMRLIDLAKTKVHEQFGIDLELEIKLW